MRRHRTTPILVIAILHLVGGGLDFIGSLCSCGSLVMVNALSSAQPATFPARPGQRIAVQNPPNVNDPMKLLYDRIPGYRAFTIVALALSFLLDAMLISGGIGLLNMQPWARWLSVVYAPISILTRIGAAVYQIVWVMPVLKTLSAGRTGSLDLSIFMSVSSWVGVIVSLLFIIYPLTVLLILFLPSTAAAFRGELPRRQYDRDDDEDEDDDDRWDEPPPRSDKIRR